ncbi:DUF4383 domain-containing protein [Amycolatopsis sp. NBC_01307]|uniref:DUF4383 domain-containing protein n=1 Tax=Amycolatopsis sp. NBC_01307 TaxID=2903561 RepID=UPI002E0DFFFF|nr:DUF4383 domain-containing protein [Amycolatopsis sp. NBC_01307]
MTVRPATHRTANVARWACRILGVLFVATGPIVVFSADTPSRWHTLLHFVTGLVALYAGFRGGAKVFCLVFGGGYLVFGALGLVLGDPAADRMWHVGPLHLMTGDHLFHVVLGAVVLAAGVVTRGRATG